MRARGLIAAIVLIAACADGRNAEPSGTVSLPVIGGSDDTAHASVVSIVTTPDASSPELCSGTVIAPRVVLTAGHCTFGQDPSVLIVGLGPSASSPTGTLTVASVLTYPEFTGSVDDLPGGTDLGVLILAEDAGVPSMPLYEGDEDTLVNGTVTVIGFGQSSADDLESRGTRRSAAVTIGGACSALLSFGDATTNACHGDSGGPLLVTGDAGVESVAGVVSYGDEIACATPSYAVRVDRYAAWIAQAIAGSLADGGACNDCPAAATDCTPRDAGVEAAAASDGSASRPPSQAPSGGCALVPGADESDSSLGGLAVLAVAIAIERRVSRQRVRSNRSPSGSIRSNQRASSGADGRGPSCALAGGPPEERSFSEASSP